MFGPLGVLINFKPILLELGIAVIQILVLTIRLAFGSRIRRTAEYVGDLVFWFGTAYMLNDLAEMKNTLTNAQQLTLWFQFWSAIIILIGLSLLARAVLLYVAAKRHPKLIGANA